MGGFFLRKAFALYHYFIEAELLSKSKNGAEETSILVTRNIYSIKKTVCSKVNEQITTVWER